MSGTLGHHSTRWARTAIVTLLVAGASAGVGAASTIGLNRLGARGQSIATVTQESWGRLLRATLPKRLQGDPQLVVSPDFASDGTAALATTTGVLATTDGGVTWRTIGFAGQRITAIAISPNFKQDVSGAIYVATANPTTPSGVLGNGGFGNASLWFIENVAGEQWIPTRVYEAQIDALAVNADEDLFMSVPGTYPDLWFEWTMGAEGEPTLDTESPGLWESSYAGLTWTEVLANDYGTCGLAFDPYGRGYFFDASGAIWQSDDNGTTWQAPPRAFSYGPLTDPTFASWAAGGGSSATSYLLGIASPGCGGDVSQPTLVYQGLQPTSIDDQPVDALAADPPFAIPGHRRGIAFVATPKGIYLGGEDSTGDFWSLLPGSPAGIETLAAGKGPGGEPVVFAFDGTNVFRLEVSWPPNIAGLAIGAARLPSTIVQGSSVSAPVTVSSERSWSGRVDLADPEVAAGIAVASKPISLGPGQTSTLTYTLTAAGNAPPGSALVLPAVTAKDQSAYAGAVPEAVTVKPPPVPFEVLPITPSALSLRAGGSARVAITVERGPDWTPADAQVTLSVAGLPSGVAGTFTPASVDLGDTSAAAAALSIASSQAAAVGGASLSVVASADGVDESAPLTLDVRVPLPTSFAFSPAKPADVYVRQSSTTTITALGADRSVLVDYSGPEATLSDTLGGLDGTGATGETVLFHKGVARLSYYLTKYGVDSLQVADVSGAPRTTSGTFTVERPPVAFSLRHIPSQTIDEPFSVTVGAVDATGTTVSLYHGSAWLADESGFLYQRIGPFVNGIWTGQVTVPVLIANDVLRAGDPNGSVWYAPFEGASNAFGVVLASPLSSPGSWPQPSYDAGATNDNPDAATFAPSLSGAKVAFTLPKSLPKACLAKLYAVSCHAFSTLTAGAATIFAGGSGVVPRPVVDDGVLLPGWLAGFSAEAGRFLWSVHDDFSGPAFIDSGRAFVCNQELDQIWWPASWTPPARAPDPLEGPQAVSALGIPSWGPQPIARACDEPRAFDGQLFAIRDYDVPLDPSGHSLVASPRTSPMAIEALSETSGKTRWRLDLPPAINASLFSPASAGGGYYSPPALRVTSTNGAAPVAVVTNCGLTQTGCFGGVPTASQYPLWLGGASRGRWLWQRKFTHFPYGTGSAHQVALANVPTLARNEVANFLKESGGGSYATLDQAVHHLLVTGLEDIAAADGTIYLSVDLGFAPPTAGSSPAAEGVLALDARTGRTVWETVLWSLTSFQLVVTPSEVLIVSTSPDAGGLLLPPGATPSTSPSGLPIFPTLGNVVGALERSDGQPLYVRDGLTSAFIAGANGIHATAGGGLLFAGGWAIDAATGSVIGPLPGERNCKPTVVFPGTTSSVAVAGSWLYYLACSDERITAVRLHGASALDLAEQAYAEAMDPPGPGRTVRAREAAIAAALFRSAGDLALAGKAAALATHLGWHPLPMAPPAPQRHRLPATASLPPPPKQGGTPGSPWGTVFGPFIGLAAFVPSRRWAWRRGW